MKRKPINTGSDLDMDADEADTRERIDAQLRSAGWKADTKTLRYSKGTRPRPGVNQAIAEWPTASGPVDYVLFIGLIPYAVIEVKRAEKDIPGHVPQARRYSRDYEAGPEGLMPGAPWGVFRVPFLFVTNGRVFLRQVQEKSGIWFQDLRKTTNHPRVLTGWYSPQGLQALAESSPDRANRALKKQPIDLPGLRPYQIEAIAEVEKALAAGQRELLVAMATGTGKTRLCISLLYRLIKADRFKRILFLVDRSALGVQATDAFKEVKLENLQAFAAIYNVKELEHQIPDEDTRVHLATVQGMVKRILNPDPGEPPVSIDRYDCIVIDECHRGYNLDQHLSDKEFEFRDEQDYISQFRRVLDHFDAVKIGLTATPALHTTEIFGDPVYEYSYRQAVLDGWLIDHEPPVLIRTKLSQSGIKWQRGAKMLVYEKKAGVVRKTYAPDDLKFDVERFNRDVITEPFNRVVCDQLAAHIDPNLPGKTLVFCANDAHADLVVRLLNEAMEKRYGAIDDDLIAKITGSIDDPLKAIRLFKNEQHPRIAVTVDLLTTGVDVPQIVNLVFIRAVRSRILYEQMLGRATRLCPDLYGPGQDKETFRIFDAVNLYANLEDVNTMKPVAKDPTFTFVQLIADLHRARSAGARKLVHEQIITRLRRKRRRLEQHAEKFEERFGMKVHAFIERVATGKPLGVLRLFRQHKELAGFLDRLTGDGVIPISQHPDRLDTVGRGYGKDLQKPEDYLESFGRWLKANVNRIAALKVIATRPRDLTRAQLREIKRILDDKGYNETQLVSAWRDVKNEDIAATIIGFIRHRALGSPLVPYAERVDRALKAVLAERAWTAPQRRWLSLLANRIKAETVVDRAALDEGFFADHGGFDRLNRTFDGRFAEVVRDLQDRIWSDSAA